MSAGERELIAGLRRLIGTDCWCPGWLGEGEHTTECAENQSIIDATDAYLATAEREPASSGEGAPHIDGTLYDYDAGWGAAERGHPRDESKPCAWLNGWEYWHTIEERDRLAAQLREAQAATRRECAEELRDKAEQLRRRKADTGAWEWAARILDRFAEQWERGGSTEGYGPPSDIESAPITAQSRWCGAQATGRFLRDRGGHLLAKCGSSEIAAELATVLAAHAAAGPTPPAPGEEVK